MIKHYCGVFKTSLLTKPKFYEKLFYEKRLICSNPKAFYYLNEYNDIKLAIRHKSLKSTLAPKPITTAKKECSKHFSSNEMNDEEEKAISVQDFDFRDEEFYSLICPEIYQDDTDLIMKDLKNIVTAEDIFEMIEKHKLDMNVKHACQAVSYLSLIRTIHEQDESEKEYCFPSKLDDYQSKVRNSPQFHLVLSIIEENVSYISKKELTCLMMCLGQFKLELQESVMRKLHLEALKMIPLMDSESLSQLSFVFRDKGLKSYFTQSKMISHIQPKLDNCNATEELRLITIFLLNSRKLISNELACKYISIIEKFVEQGKLIGMKASLKILILKAIHRFSKDNYPINFCRDLMASLIDEVHLLSPSQLVSLNDSFCKQLEPAILLYKMQEHASRLIHECKNNELKTNLLLCLSLNSSFRMKKNYENLAAEQILSSQTYYHILPLYKILRYLKTSNLDLCQNFWLKTMQIAQYNFLDYKISHLFICGRYMFFNNNLGGDFRNKQIEGVILTLLEKELKTTSYISPTKFVQMFSFIIGYSPKKISEDLFDKFCATLLQFNKYDMIWLSQGINIFNNIKSPRENIHVINNICNQLDKTTMNLLKNSSLSDIATLTRAYIFYKHSPHSSLLNVLIEKHSNYIDQLNSRNINIIMWNFRKIFFNDPKVFDAVSKYIIENENHVLPNTIHIVLSCFYTMGYSPSKCNEFAFSCQRVIEMHCDRMGCHHLLETCLSLALFKSLSSELIHYIFNMQFLNQLDEEIQSGYSKKYSYLVRSLLMQLNRAVCIDYPEEKIPWFHEQYCIQQCKLETYELMTTSFHEEVYEALSSILGNPNMIAINKKSPYYYNLDLEFALNMDGKPVSPHERNLRSKKSSTEKLEDEPYKRVAVLLRDYKSYCSNDRILSGKCQLERRHLEMLGYVVVELPHYDWYSMANSTSMEKITFLKSILYKELLSVS